MPTYSTVNNFSYEFPCALFGRVIDFLQMKNMTKEQLEEILSKVWMREWSAVDASDAIWGESFDGYTQPIPEEPKSPTA